MKTKLLIAAMCVWLALPHGNSAAEIRVLKGECPNCAGDLRYTVGNTEATCDSCGEKLALVLLMIGGVILVGAAGCYTIKKIKKLNGRGGPLNVTNRFGTNLDAALRSTNVMSLVQMEPTDVPYLLSLATAPSSSGRYVLESSTNLQNWVELGRYERDDFLAVHPAPHSAAFYRVRVQP